MKTKEEIKAKLLEKYAGLMKANWHAQAVHKVAVAAWFLDHLGIKGEQREKAFKEWSETPTAFGANSSAFNQSLGHLGNGKAKLEQVFSKF